MGEAMPTPEIEEFARILVRQVRDKAIKDCALHLDPKAQGESAKRWRGLAGDQHGIDVARSLAPECVDEAIFYLLYAIDDGLLQLSFRASNGRVVDLTSEGLGELAGSYIGPDGWCDHYSKERLVER